MEPRTWIAGAALGLAAALAAPPAHADECGDRFAVAPTSREVRDQVWDPCAKNDIVVKGCCRSRDTCGWPVDPCGDRYGRFEATVEATLSFLDEPEGTFGEGTGAGDQIVWDRIDYGAAFGARGALQYAITPFDRIQARVAWFGSWDDEDTQTGVFGFSPPPTVSAATTANLFSEADAFTAELSWVRELACGGLLRIDGILGLRVATFDETASATIAPVPLPGASGTVSAEAENLFYGGQLGVGFHLDVASRVELSFLLKGFLGGMSREATVNDSGLFTAGAKSNQDESDELAYGAQAEVGILWRLSSRVALTAGYSLFFLDGVSRANDAMDFSRVDTGAVQPRLRDENVLIHSVFLGVNLNF